MREQLEQMGLKIWPSATNFLTCCPQGELTARLAAACEQQYGSQGEKNTADAGRNVLIPQTAGEENFGARLYQSSCIAGMPADHGRPAAGKC